MEIDPSNAENPDQLSWCSDDQDLLGYVRSYRCSFCKRGFSNAQALGGHMNIHRKDRARLKEFSTHDNNNPFSGITKMGTLNQPPLSVDIGDSVQREFFKTETSCSPRRARASSDQEVDTDAEDEYQLQLSLFTEASSTNNDKEKEGNDRVTGEHTKRRIQLSQCGSVPELDLELRLGTDPPETSRKG